MARSTGIRAALAATAVVAAVAAAGLARAAAPADARGPVRYGRVELQRDADAIAAVGASGVIAEVRRDGRSLRATSGVADLATRAPLDPAGHFRTGSTTKTFVAVVALQLVGERRLSLDDSVERWLPGVVAGNGHDGRAITVRHLLQHTSGLYDYTDDLAAEIVSEEAYRAIQFKTFDPATLIAAALAHPPRFAPGRGFEYANTNYVLVGRIIEEVTGRTWEAEVRDRILRPLRLRGTAAPGTATALPRPHATGYLVIERDHPLDVTDQNMTWAGAAGALTSTTADLSRFLQALAQGRLLRRAEQAALEWTVPATEFEEDTPGIRYGLGIEWRPLSCGGGFWGHGGDVPGFTTVNGVSADGRTTVVVSLSTTAADQMHPTAWRLVDRALCGRA